MIVDFEKIKAKFAFSDLHFANLADDSYRARNEVTTDLFSTYEGLAEQIAHVEAEHGLVFVLKCDNEKPQLDKVAIAVSDFLS